MWFPTLVQLWGRGSLDEHLLPNVRCGLLEAVGGSLLQAKPYKFFTKQSQLGRSLNTAGIAYPCKEACRVKGPRVPEGCMLSQQSPQPSSNATLVTGSVCVAWNGAPDVVTVILRLETASIRRTKGIVQKLIQHFKPHKLECIGKGAGEEAAKKPLQGWGAVGPAPYSSETHVCLLWCPGNESSLLAGR